MTRSCGVDIDGPRLLQFANLLKSVIGRRLFVPSSMSTVLGQVTDRWCYLLHSSPSYFPMFLLQFGLTYLE